MNPCKLFLCRLLREWNPAALRLLFSTSAADVREAVEWERQHRA